MKNSLVEFKAEERISELKDRTMGFTVSEEEKEKGLKKSRWNLKDL